MSRRKASISFDSGLTPVVRIGSAGPPLPIDDPDEIDDQFVRESLSFITSKTVTVTLADMFEPAREVDLDVGEWEPDPQTVVRSMPEGPASPASDSDLIIPGARPVVPLVIRNPLRTPTARPTIAGPDERRFESVTDLMRIMYPDARPTTHNLYTPLQHAVSEYVEMTMTFNLSLPADRRRQWEIWPENLGATVFLFNPINKTFLTEPVPLLLTPNAGVSSVAEPPAHWSLQIQEARFLLSFRELLKDYVLVVLFNRPLSKPARCDRYSPQDQGRVAARLANFGYLSAHSTPSFVAIFNGLFKQGGEVRPLQERKVNLARVSFGDPLDILVSAYKNDLPLTSMELSSTVKMLYLPQSEDIRPMLTAPNPPALFLGNLSEAKPSLLYRHEVVVSLKDLNTSSLTADHRPRANIRNIVARVTLRISDSMTPESIVRDCIVLPSSGERAHQFQSMVLYHKPCPQFWDRVKILLPPALKPETHLFIQFFHVVCKRTTQEPNRLVHFAETFVPLFQGEGACTALRDSGETTAFIWEKLSPGYLTAATPETALCRQQPVFRTHLHVSSSIYPRNPELFRFVTLVAESGNPAEAENMLATASAESICQFFPAFLKLLCSRMQTTLAAELQGTQMNPSSDQLFHLTVFALSRVSESISEVHHEGQPFNAHAKMLEAFLRCHLFDEYFPPFETDTGSRQMRARALLAGQSAVRLYRTLALCFVKYTSTLPSNRVLQLRMLRYGWFFLDAIYKLFLAADYDRGTNNTSLERGIKNELFELCRVIPREIDLDLGLLYATVSSYAQFLRICFSENVRPQFLQAGFEHLSSFLLQLLPRFDRDTFQLLCQPMLDSLDPGYAATPGEMLPVRDRDVLSTEPEMERIRRLTSQESKTMELALFDIRLTFVRRLLMDTRYPKLVVASERDPLIKSIDLWRKRNSFACWCCDTVILGVFKSVMNPHWNKHAVKAINVFCRHLALLDSWAGEHAPRLDRFADAYFYLILRLLKEPDIQIFQMKSPDPDLMRGLLISVLWVLGHTSMTNRTAFYQSMSRQISSRRRTISLLFSQGTVLLLRSLLFIAAAGNRQCGMEYLQQQITEILSTQSTAELFKRSAELSIRTSSSDVLKRGARSVSAQLHLALNKGSEGTNKARYARDIMSNAIMNLILIPISRFLLSEVSRQFDMVLQSAKKRKAKAGPSRAQLAIFVPVFVQFFELINDLLVTPCSSWTLSYISRRLCSADSENRGGIFTTYQSRIFSPLARQNRLLRNISDEYQSTEEYPRVPVVHMLFESLVVLLRSSRDSVRTSIFHMFLKLFILDAPRMKHVSTRVLTDYLDSLTGSMSPRDRRTIYAKLGASLSRITEIDPGKVKEAAAFRDFVSQTLVSLLENTAQLNAMRDIPIDERDLEGFCETINKLVSDSHSVRHLQLHWVRVLCDELDSVAAERTEALKQDLLESHYRILTKIELRDSIKSFLRKYHGDEEALSALQSKELQLICKKHHKSVTQLSNAIVEFERAVKPVVFPESGYAHVVLGLLYLRMLRDARHPGILDVHLLKGAFALTLFAPIVREIMSDQSAVDDFEDSDSNLFQNAADAFIRAIELFEQSGYFDAAWQVTRFTYRMLDKTGAIHVMPSLFSRWAHISERVSRSEQPHADPNQRAVGTRFGTFFLVTFVGPFFDSVFGPDADLRSYVYRRPPVTRMGELGEYLRAVWMRDGAEDVMITGERGFEDPSNPKIAYIQLTEVFPDLELQQPPSGAWGRLLQRPVTEFHYNAVAFPNGRSKPSRPDEKSIIVHTVTTESSFPTGSARSLIVKRSTKRLPPPVVVAMEALEPATKLLLSPKTDPESRLVALSGFLVPQVSEGLPPIFELFFKSPRFAFQQEDLSILREALDSVFHAFRTALDLNFEYVCGQGSTTKTALHWEYAKGFNELLTLFKPVLSSEIEPLVLETDDDRPATPVPESG